MSDIEPIIKQDLALSYRLMRYINSSMFGLRSEIRSVGHAMLLMGERDVRRWATLATLSTLSNNKPAALIETGLIRAHFCENLAPLVGNDIEHGDELFLLGLFSVLDACMDMPMADALKDLAVPARVKGALCGVPGTMRDILELVIAVERGDWDFLDRHGQNIGLAALAGAYVASIDWALAASAVERESRRPSPPANQE